MRGHRLGKGGYHVDRGPDLYCMVHMKQAGLQTLILPRQVEKILLASANMKYGLGGQSSALTIIVLDVYTGYREIYGGM